MCRSRVLVSFAAALAVLSLHAQVSLHLKSGDIQPPTQGDHRAGAIRRLDTGHWHGVVRMSAVSPEALAGLRERGVKVLAYVPGGFFVSVPEGVSLAGTGVEWSSTLDPARKISPALDANSDAASDFMVEFHGDVSEGDARTVALRSGFPWKERGDLLPNHLLITGPRNRLPQLAEWDEVAYIFPAMGARRQAGPLYACGGAVHGRRTGRAIGACWWATAGTAPD